MGTGSFASGEPSSIVFFLEELEGAWPSFSVQDAPAGLSAYRGLRYSISIGRLHTIKEGKSRSCECDAAHLLSPAIFNIHPASPSP